MPFVIVLRDTRVILTLLGWKASWTLFIIVCLREKKKKKKAEHQTIDAFELWCWRRLLGVTWTERRSKHSILKEINPQYSLERLMLKLKIQYFGHLIWWTDSLEKTLMLGKIESRRRGWQRTRRLDAITDSIHMSLSKLQKMVKERKAWDTTVHGVMKSWTRLTDWTTTILY